MKRKSKPDRPLVFKVIPVSFLDGTSALARAEGNNATWHCRCTDDLPMMGRCYYAFGWNCHSICPKCGMVFRVLKDQKKKAREVRQISA